MPPFKAEQICIVLDLSGLYLIYRFQGLAQATQPTPDPVAYKAHQSADLFMHHPPPRYPHPSSAAKLNSTLNFAAVHSSNTASNSGSIFPSAASYWTSSGAANLYSNIASHHHSSMQHHSGHIASYPHYA